MAIARSYIDQNELIASGSHWTAILILTEIDDGTEKGIRCLYFIGDESVDDLLCSVSGSCQCYAGGSKQNCWWTKCAPSEVRS